MWGFGSEAVRVCPAGVGEGQHPGPGEPVAESRPGDPAVVWVS